MKTKQLLLKLLASILAAFLSIGLYAQTGPAGVGNSDGSSGQPRNVLWLDANSQTFSNGDPIPQWTDRSGNNNNATQGTAVRQPQFITNSLNGRSIVYFDNSAGSGDEEDFLLYDGSIIVNTDLTVFFVAARRQNNRQIVLGGTTTTGNQNMHFGWNTSSQAICNHWSNDIYGTLDGDGSGYIGDGDTSDDYGIFINRLASTETDPQRRLFQNGKELGSRNNANKLSSYDGAAIARWSNGSIRYYNVNVAEVIQYSTALNTTQRILVENYLATKYDIALNTGAGAVAVYSGFGTFDYDVAGIGRTSGTDGHSRGSSAGFYLFEDGGSQLNDGAYMMYGHNNTANDTPDQSANVTGSGAEAAWPRSWYIKKTSVSSGTVRVVFDFQEGYTNGGYPENTSDYVLLKKTTPTGAYTKVTAEIVTQGLEDADQIYFEIAATDLTDGAYYTIGTNDQTNSPIQGTAAQTWYALKSGNWDDWETWTLDPSGYLPNNPSMETPSSSGNASDNVYIPTGKTITVQSGQNNKTNQKLTVDGRLDLGNTTGHTFSEIRGSGRILMAEDNFPSGDATHFYTKGQGEGTVVFYGSGATVTNSHTFFNVELELDNASDVVVMKNNLTVNGNLTIGTGTLQINDNTDDNIVNLTVNGDVLVDTNGKITVGTGNTNATTAYSIGGTMPANDFYHTIFHQVTFNGNLTNNGSIRFTNQNDPIYNQFTSTGAATVYFTGAQNSEAKLNGTTDFYNLVINKGSDQTYQLNINSSSTSNFALYGPNNVGRTGSNADPEVRKALWIKRGTLKLTGSILIPTLSEGSESGGNGDYTIGRYSALWVASSGVSVYCTASDNSTSGNTQVNDGSGASVNTTLSNQALSLFGMFRITAGVFDTRNSAGFIFWDEANGQVRIEGGNVEAAQFRSASVGAGNASYFQSGGTLTVTGNGNGSYDQNYPLFGLATAESVFSMTGGEIILQSHDSDTTPEFYIPSSDGNYSVTGGKLTVEIDDASTFEFSSTANLWDVEFTNTTGSGNIDIDLLSDLKVGNDLTLNPYVTLDVRNPDDLTTIYDLYIGRNFSILEDGTTTNTATYEDRTNTTYFDGTEDGELYINWKHDTDYEQLFYNLVIDKPVGKTLLLKGDTEKQAANVSSGWFSRIVRVENDFKLKSGTLNQGEHSIRLFGSAEIQSDGTLGVYTSGVTETNASIVFRGDGLTVQTENGAKIGNLKMDVDDPANHEIVFTSDVEITRMGYQDGKINMGQYNLKIDYLHNGYQTSSLLLTDPNITASGGVFYFEGNASDGGLSLLIPSTTTDGTSFGFPIGISGKYTPAEVELSGVSDEGYITITPTDGELLTTDQTGGDLLSYYWRVKHDDFSTLPTVEYIFTYDDSDIVGIETNYVAGKVLDESPFTRSYEDSSVPESEGVDAANNTITFNGAADNGLTLENANYTAGVTTRFVGAPTVYYSRAIDGQWWEWQSTNNWSTDAVNKHIGAPAGSYPGSGDVVVVGSDYVNNLTTGPYSKTGEGRHQIRIDGSVGDVDVAQIIFDSKDGATALVVNAMSRVYVRSGITLDAGIISGKGEMVQDVGPAAGNFGTINADLGDFVDDPDNGWFFWLRGAAGTTTISDRFKFPNMRPFGGGSAGTRSITFSEDIEATSIVVDNYVTLRVENDITCDGELLIGSNKEGYILFPNNGTDNTFEVGSLRFDGGSDADPNSITVENAGTDTHIFKINGDITINNGTTFDLTSASGSNVILELAGSGNHSFTNSTGLTPDLYRIVMNKGTDQTSSFSFENDFDLNGSTSGIGASKALELTNGKFIVNNSAIDIDLTTGDDDFTIPETTCLEVRDGTVRASGDDTGIYLDGKLLVSGGNVYLTGAGNGNNYIQYSASGNATLEITGGELQVGSQLRRGVVSEEGILNYTQSGGVAVFGVNAAPEGDRGVFEILNTGSSFTHSGGDFYIARQQSSPTIASLYFDPETLSLGAGTQLTIGHTSTPAGQDIGLFINKTIQNLTISNSSSNSPAATLWTVPLDLEQTLSINSGTSLDASGLQISLQGFFINNGTYTHNDNLVLFNGSSDQEIQGSGTTTFYQLTKNTSNALTLYSDIVIDDDLRVEAGTINDNSNEITLKGDIYNIGTISHGGTGNGLIFQGSIEQSLDGTGTYGKMTIDNYENVKVQEGYNITIQDAIQLSQGVFDIGSKLLIIEENASFVAVNPYSTTNMVNTNRSFTDNGIQKILPSGASSLFIPIGSGGKYTPVNISLTQNSATNGELIIKAADEYHPTVTDDSEAPDCELVDTDNMLQFYWSIKSTNITDAIGIVEFYYDSGDVAISNACGYDIADYIPAKVLGDGSGNWLKYDWADFDESNEKVIFRFDNISDSEITGDYTAGIQPSPVTIKGAIPDLVPVYETVASGDWSDPTIWNPNITGGPSGAIVKVNAAHDVKIDHNYISVFTTEILGTITQGSTFGNRLGNVTGTGTLKTSSEIIPAGYYEDFVSTSGGTLEYEGSSNIDVLNNLAFVNNLIFSGTGERRLPNIDFTVRGDLTINGDDASLNVVNEHNKRVILKGDVTFSQGSFDAGSGANAFVEFSGSAQQQLTGDFTGSNAFNNFEIDNSNGVVLNSTVEIDDELHLTLGKITTTASNVLRLNSLSESAVTGESNDSYIAGPLQKKISAGGDFVFPVGDGSRIGRVTLSSVSNASADYWEAEYNLTDPSTDSFDISRFNAPIQAVNSDEYWRIKAPSASLTAQVAVGWTNLSNFSTAYYQDSEIRIIEWIGNADAEPNREWNEIGNSVSGTTTLGSVGTSAARTFNEYTTEYTPSGNFFTIGVTNVRFEWDGSDDTDWNLAANWTRNQVPTTSDNIVIPSGMPRYPALNSGSDAIVNNLTIESGATLTVPSNQVLDIRGALLNNGTLHLLNEAQLLDAGDIDGTGSFKMDRYVTGGYAYHYLSSPVENATDATLANKFVHSNGFAYIFKFTEANANGDLRNNSGWSQQSGLLEIGKGYGVTYHNNATETFSGGKFNTGNLSTTITYQAVDAAFRGWNLVGNPYPSNLNAQAFVNANTKIDGTLRFWDDDKTLGDGYQTNDYAYWNSMGGTKANEGTKEPTDYIAAGQAFFVSHNSGEGTSNLLNFTNAMRNTGSAVFFKKNQDTETIQRLKLELKGTKKNEYHQTLVGFKADATEGYDRLYDGRKAPVHLENAPANFYSLLEEDPYAIQGLPLRWEGAPKDLTVKLGVNLRFAKEYTLNLIQFENFAPGYDIYLVDKTAGKTLNLRETTTYTFSANAGLDQDRFELHFDQQGIDWTGAVSTDWNEPGNWSTGAVPSPNDNVVIKPVANMPAINNHVSLRGLYVEPTTTLTVLPNASLTMNGDWVNEGTCILKADASGFGTLIDNGTISGDGIFDIEMYVTPNQWHLFGNPTQNPDPTLTGAWVKGFNETANEWEFLTKGTDLVQGKGYAMWVQEAKTFTFSGKPHTGLTQEELSSSAGGWNLVANNYPSFADWDNANWSRTTTDETVYMWNGTQYGAYISGMNGIGTNSASNQIAPMQGVFVRSTTIGDLSFNNQVRKTHFAAKKSTTPTQMLRFRVEKDGRKDETIIAFNATAQRNAIKLFSDAEKIHSLYSEKEGKELAINTYAGIETGMTIPINLHIQEDGTYLFHTDFIDAFSVNTGVELKDLKTDKMHNLREASNFEFEALTTDDPKRFELHLTKGALSIKETNLSGFAIYSNSDNIYIRQLSDLTDAEVGVFNTLGERVVVHLIKQKDLTQIDMGAFAKGVYMVKVKTKRGIHSKQVFIK